MFRAFIDSGCTNGGATGSSDRQVRQSGSDEGVEVGLNVVNKARWKKNSEMAKWHRQRCIFYFI